MSSECLFMQLLRMSDTDQTKLAGNAHISVMHTERVDYHSARFLLDIVAALKFAAFKDNNEYAKSLIATGGALNVQYDGEWNALILAANHGNTEIDRSLIISGTSLDLEDRFQ